MPGIIVRLLLVFLVSSFPLQEGLAMSFERENAPSDLTTVEQTDEFQSRVDPMDEGGLRFVSSFPVAGPDEHPNIDLLLRDRLASVSPLLNEISFPNFSSDTERLPEVHAYGSPGSAHRAPYADASQSPSSGAQAYDLDSGRDGRLPGTFKVSVFAPLPPAAWLLPTLACLVAFVQRSARTRI